MKIKCSSKAFILACLVSTGANANIIGPMTEGSSYDWSVESASTLAYGTFTCDALCMNTQVVDYYNYFGSEDYSIHIIIDGTYTPSGWHLIPMTFTVSDGSIDVLSIWALIQELNGPNYYNPDAGGVSVYGEYGPSVVERETILRTSLSLTSASPVPVPAAVWLFGSGLLGLIGVARSKRQS